MKPPCRSLRRRIAASIACLAFVLQGFVPVLAQAAASATRGQLYLGTLCSADHAAARMRLDKALDAEAPAPLSSSSLGAAHCAFCALPWGADAPTPPSFGWRISHVDIGALPPVVPIVASPATPARGQPQAPRAPPRT